MLLRRGSCCHKQVVQNLEASNNVLLFAGVAANLHARFVVKYVSQPPSYENIIVFIMNLRVL